MSSVSLAAFMSPNHHPSSFPQQYLHPQEVHPIVSFHTTRTIRCTTTGTSLYAIGVLARKAKEMDVKQYVESGIEPSVLSKVQQLDTYFATKPMNKSPVETEIGPVQKALTKRKGTLSIIAEYKRKFPKEYAGFIAGEIFDPMVLSPVFREFGASAIAVTADSRTGGATYEDLAVFVQEQETAQGNVPGPLPIICNDFIVDPIQLCRSAALGAHAVVLHLNVVGLEKAKYLQDCAKNGLQLETIFAVSNRKDAIVAWKEIGTSMIYVIGVDSMEEKIDIAEGLQEEIQKEEGNPTSPHKNSKVCIIANILANDNKGLEEVEEAWVCRDKGFNAVWVSDALYKSGNDPTEHCGAIIKSMTAKSSVKWASAKARSGKGEGAREYLGDILM